MPDYTDHREGTPRRTEWQGLWRSSINDRPVSDEEFYRCADSLYDWLELRYNLKWSQVKKRDCYVRGDVLSHDRTQQVIVTNCDILERAFLEYLQQWLRGDWRSWRIELPTDETDESLILVYPDVIRVNPSAEADLDTFLNEIKPKIREADSRARMILEDLGRRALELEDSADGGDERRDYDP
jgi:hypothetical protein